MLERFRQEKVTVGESAPSSREEGAAAEGEGGGGGGASVKYLSSSRLMGLQLRDATFRRHFLVQCLVLMQASPILCRAAPPGLAADAAAPACWLAGLLLPRTLPCSTRLH